ncbi:MAG: hypothetical protein P4N59_33845 [Negativicutes bacterium]|nr:hypothetical protein [Negativicutes bacterium]
MQHEFNNRIVAQRRILQVVNRKGWNQEDLFGLSSKAIDRWISVNRIDRQDKLVNLVKTAAGKLFFLANKSQEQITEDYFLISNEVAALHDAIAMEVEKPA